MPETRGVLTTNDNESIEAAMRNHTIHPQGGTRTTLNKYIWRFIALSTAQPRVITIEATSEQEARQQSPAGCVMVFAARIRQGVPCPICQITSTWINPHFNCEHDIAKRFIPLRMGLLTIYQWLLRQLVA